MGTRGGGKNHGYAFDQRTRWEYAFLQIMGSTDSTREKYISHLHVYKDYLVDLGEEEDEIGKVIEGASRHMAE